MNIITTCPVCNGKGLVNWNFYEKEGCVCLPEEKGDVICRSCHGTGCFFQTDMKEKQLESIYLARANQAQEELIYARRRISELEKNISDARNEILKGQIILNNIIV